MIVKRIKAWFMRRRIQCPVGLKFVYPARADKPNEGEMIIEVFLGHMLPNEVAERMEAWLEEMDKIDGKKV